MDKSGIGSQGSFLTNRLKAINVCKVDRVSDMFNCLHMLVQCISWLQSCFILNLLCIEDIHYQIKA